MRTDHSTQIMYLRTLDSVPEHVQTELKAAAEILECHDTTGISLDNWTPVRTWVEGLIGETIQENHA